MIQEVFSCIFCIIVLEEFIVQEIQFSSMEDDHICKSTINTYHHQILFFRKKNIYNPPPPTAPGQSFQIGKFRLGEGVRCTSAPQRGGKARSVRDGEGVGTQDPSFHHIWL